ncbi:perilipin-4 isoform X1 [Mastomys coucha]|uniref:perilipin-4 isoform X1 n=1 Tax=Mastomys coucha TaxID=35658 RepID=UPI0012628950|nr:perilipin-4 isoform X1 [Mastomys coucha]
MSASGDGTRGSPKSKGKTLSSFFGSLPGFSSARNLVSHTHSSISTKDLQTAADPSGTPVPSSPVSTNSQMAGGAAGLLQPSEQTAGNKDTGGFSVTSSNNAFSSGVFGIMDAAKGMVQGGLGATQSALVGTKEAVSGGVMGAVGVAKGLVKGSLDTSKNVLTNTKDTVTTGLMGAANMAKGTVQTGLDTTKSVVMGTKDTVTTGLTGAMNVAKGTVQTGLDTTKSVVMGTKDTVTTGLTGAMNMAKGAVQGGLDTTKSVVMGTKDTVTTGLTGASNVAKGTVQMGLDTSKSMLMGTKDTVCAGATGAINVVKGAAQGGLDTSNAALTVTMNMARGTMQMGLNTSKHTLTGMKDTVCAGVTGAMNMAKGIHMNTDATRDTQSTVLAHSGNIGTNAIHTGVHTVPSSLSGSHSITCHEPSSYRATNQGVRQDTLTSTEFLCCETSSFSDTYGLGYVTEPTAATETLVSGMASSAYVAPGSVEECGQLAATGFATLPDELEGLGEIFQAMTAEEQAQLAVSESGPRVLSTDRGSYYIRLGDLAPSFRQRALEHALSHIQHSQFQARAALAQLQEAFQMTDITMEAPGGKLCRDQSLSTVVEATDSHEMRVSVAQDRLCTLAHQLHAAYSSLANSLQGLPEVQQQAGQARHSLCKLYGLVSSEAGSELQTEQLVQSSAGVVQAWQGLEVLLDKLQQSPPLSWLVGPFTSMPCGQL